MRCNPLARRTAPLALLSAAALLAGCQSARIKSSQGFIVDETLVAAIQPGVDNRDSVEKTLGRPTWTAQFDANEWYYVSRNTSQLAFLRPKVVSESIIIVNFDARGGVTRVDRDGMSKIVAVRMEKDKTPTKGRETGIFEDLFGNIGQFGGAGLPGSGNDGGSGRDGPR